MSYARNHYYKIVQDDEVDFGQGPIIYDNAHIVIKRAVDLCPPMPKPWDKRPQGEDSVRGLCLHHSAVWSPFTQQNRTAKMRRPGAQERLTYTLGVHHAPTRHDGKIVVYQFNEFDETSWHSGGKAKNATDHYKRLQKTSPHRRVNDVVVALCLRGLLTTPWHEENWPEKQPKSQGTIRRKQQNDLILKPSREQIEAIWGVHLFMQERFRNYEGDVVGDGSWFIGHKDTGKEACPGNVAYDFILKMRAGQLENFAAVESFMEDHDLRLGGYPADDQTEPSAKLPDPWKFQWLLVTLGFDLGPWGSHKDGVDGKWGYASSGALEDFERNEGLLTNGEPDIISYEKLFERHSQCYGAEPIFQGDAVKYRSRMVRSYVIEDDDI